VGSETKETRRSSGTKRRREEEKEEEEEENPASSDKRSEAPAISSLARSGSKVLIALMDS